MCQESVGGVILDRDVARPQFLSQKTDAAAVTASHPLKIIPLKLFCNHAIRKSNFFLILLKVSYVKVRKS